MNPGSDHPDVFYYTNQGEAVVIDGVDDAAEMTNTREAFSLLGKFYVAKVWFSQCCSNNV